jgi:hypothetical protein
MNRGLFVALALLGCEATSSENTGKQASYVSVQVDGRSVEIPCERLDADFTKPVPAELNPTFHVVGGASESTGLNWLVKVPATGAELEAAAATRHAVLAFDAPQLWSTDPDLAIKVMLPAGDTSYRSEAADISDESYHQVTTETVTTTETAITYRLHGTFKGHMQKVGGSSALPMSGDWSLLVTYPK